MQRLTDIWRNLIGGREQAGQGDADDEDDPVQFSRPTNDEVDATYHNLYWTRVVSVKDGVDGEIERWPMAADIIECLDTLQEVAVDPNAEHKLIFDPIEFAQLNPGVRVSDFRLGEDTLRDWAVRGTAVRRSFKKRAEQYASMDIEVEDPVEEGRTRRGMVYSVASRNPEGLSERQIAQQMVSETVPARKYKPRHRRELSVEEQESIVQEYHVQQLPQKDIARRFRVTPQLVSYLVSESRCRTLCGLDARRRNKLEAR